MYKNKQIPIIILSGGKGERFGKKNFQNNCQKFLNIQ